MSRVLDAAYHVVHDYPGGADSLGPRLSKPATTLSHEAKGTGAAKFGLETAVKASVLTRDYRILHAFAAECGHMALPLPETVAADGATMMDCQATFFAEVADVVRELGQVLADGRVTRNERDAVRQQAGELIAALQAMVGRVDVMHSDSIPAHTRG